MNAKQDFLNLHKFRRYWGMTREEVENLSLEEYAWLVEEADRVKRT